MTDCIQPLPHPNPTPLLIPCEEVADFPSLMEIP
jgi:hypothetical protein